MRYAQLIKKDERFSIAAVDKSLDGNFTFEAEECLDAEMLNGIMRNANATSRKL
jgi:hypothetical protein